MNWIGLKTLYMMEMKRSFAIPLQTIISPVLTTMLYFVVFGTAIGAAVSEISGVSYKEFIVPGLIMMSLLMNSVMAASSGIFFPVFMGTAYEIFSAPLSYFEITAGYVMAAVTRSIFIGLVILGTSMFFTEVTIVHPFLAFLFSFVTALAFSLFGFILGITADSFEKLNVFPSLILTPLSFLGGVFYSIKSLPEFWQNVSLFNPIVYMIDGLRWSFFGISSVNPWISFSAISLFTFACILVLVWIFTTGYKIKK